LLRFLAPAWTIRDHTLRIAQLRFVLLALCLCLLLTLLLFFVTPFLHFSIDLFAALVSHLVVLSEATFPVLGCQVLVGTPACFRVMMTHSLVDSQQGERIDSRVVFKVILEGHLSNFSLLLLQGTQLTVHSLIVDCPCLLLLLAHNLHRRHRLVRSHRVSSA